MTPVRSTGGAEAIQPDRAARAETLRVLLLAGIGLLAAAATISALVNRDWRGVVPYGPMIVGHVIVYAVLSKGRLHAAISIHTTFYLLSVHHTPRRGGWGKTRSGSSRAPR